jgi:hypothetical protein
MSELFTQVTRVLKIKKLNSAAYHPQTNGALERSHGTLKDYLRCMATTDNWNESLPMYIFAYNTTPHTITKISPYELIFGQIARIPCNVPHEPREETYIDYARRLSEKLNNSQSLAKQNRIESKIKSKALYDQTIRPRDFEIGDLVLITNESAGPLDQKFHGPYPIINRINESNFEIKIKGKLRVVHANRMKNYHETTV